MNVTFWVALLFGISVSLYLLGGESQMTSALDKYTSDPTLKEGGTLATGTDVGPIFNGFINSILQWNTWLIIIAIGAGAIMGLNLLALIPLGAVMIILNYAVFPLSFVTESLSGLPEVQTIVTLFFTLTELMIIFSLIRGSFH